MDDKGMGIVL